MNDLIIHRAKWVVPVTSPIIEDGAIAVFHDKIVAVGASKDIFSRFHGKIMDHGSAILCPGLVNCHTHLELSVLHMRLSPTGSFTRWVTNMLEAAQNISEQDKKEAIKKTLAELKNNGTIALGDVGNTITPVSFLSASSINSLFFHEIICLKEQDKPDITGLYQRLTTLQNDTVSATITPHACYSVFPQLIIDIKQICKQNKKPFSIHVAESEEEMEFLATGKGPMQTFLEKRGKWPLEFEIPKTSPIRYLHKLGVLDTNTICIHCVHLDEEDLAILSSSGATACLCPRSNLFLGSGIPPVSKLVAQNIPFALGTDSLASNDKLSIFAEMASLARLAPEIPSEMIFEAATMGGAKALKLHDRIGSLEPNKKAHFLSINTDVCNSKKQIYDFLVHYQPNDTDREGMKWIIPNMGIHDKSVITHYQTVTTSN